MTDRLLTQDLSRQGFRSLFAPAVALVALLVALLMGAAPALAADVTWNDDGGDQNWTTGDNWDTDTAPTNDTATDTAVFGVKGGLGDPTLDAARSVNRLNFTDVGWTLDGAQTLTVGAGGVDSAGAGTNTIDAATGITMDAASAWTVGTGNTLDVNGVVDNGGFELTVDGDGTVNLDGVVSGNGGVTMDGDGTLNLNAVNTYIGTTEVNAGTVNIGAAGVVAGPVVYTAGTLTIDGTLNDSVTMAGVGLTLGGTGAVSVETVGIDSTGAGTNTVAGTLSVSLTANSSWLVDAGNTLDVNAAVDNGGFDLTAASVASTSVTNFDGVISGAGDFNKTGAGTVNLTAANTYTGDTTISAGTLNLSGSITSDVTLSGGTFMGTGTVTGNVNATGGTVAPGASVGTMTVNGNFDVGAAGTINFELDKTANTNDLISVTGTASIADNASVSVSQTDAMQVEAGDSFTFLSAAGGLTATTANISFTDSLLGLWDLTWAVVGNDLVATAGISSGAFAAATTTSDNPGIGVSLDSLFVANPTDPLITSVGNMTAAQRTQFVNDTDAGGRASGQVAAMAAVAGAQSFVGHQNSYMAARRSGSPTLTLYMDPATQFNSPILAAAGTDPAVLAAALAEAEKRGNGQGQSAAQPRQVEGDAGPNGEPTGTAVDGFPDPFTRRGRLAPTDEQKYGGYLKGVGLYVNQESESGRTGYELTGAGFQGGVDMRLDEQWIGGLSLGYTHSQVDLAGGLGEIDIDSIRFGPYVSYQRREWFMDASATFGYHFHDSTRTTALGDATADYNAWDTTVYGGVGYGWEFGRVTLAPTASLQYTYFNREDYTESGPGAMTLGEHGMHTLHSRLGGTWTYVWEQTDGPTLVPELSAGWEHELLGDDDAIEAAFAGGGAGFSILNESAEENAIYVGGGLSVLLDRGRSLFLRYDGTFSDSQDAHAVSAGLTFRF